MATTQNRKIKRGDRLSLTFYADGDLTGRKLTFAAKENGDLGSDRIIEKKNTLAGGSTRELSAVYSAITLKTTITVEILTADTADLPARAYPFDIESVNVNDPTDIVTPIDGELTVTADAQSAFDNYPALPQYAKRFSVLDATAANAGDLIQCVWDNDLQKNVFTFISIAQLKQQLELI